MDEPIRVLHVDDDPDFGDPTATFLEQEDGKLTVETATSAGEGLDRLTDDVDCIVSDYDMPGTDGIEFLESVREDRPDLPFILFTGKGSEEIASDAISAGVTDYLEKGSGTGQYAVLANRIRNAVDQYRSHNALEASEKRLSLFIEQSPLGVVEWDEEFTVVRLNDAAEEILGYDEDQLRGRSWEAIVPESDRDTVGEVVSELLEAEGGYHSINENVRADGERIVCEWHNRVVTDDDGDTVAIFSQFQDVTERRKREERLRNTTARLEALFEHSPDMINLHDAEGNIIDPNPRLCEETGYDESELTGMKVWELDRAVDPAEATALWEDMEPGDRIRIDGVFERRDGSAFPVEVHVRRLDLEGEDRFVAISRDVTERREREQDALRYRQMVNAMREAACIYDEEGRFEVVNDHLAEFYDSTPSELEGRESNLIPEIRAGSHGDPYRELIDGDREEIRGEIEAEFPGHGHAVLDYRLTRLVVDGEFEGVVAVAREVTQRRQNQRELERYKHIIEEMNDGVVVVEGGTITYTNPEVSEIVGYAPETISGSRMGEFIAPEDRETVRRRFRRRIEGDNPPETYEFNVLAKDGDRVPVEITVARVEHGTEPTTVSIVRDVSDRKRRERELERQNERLEEFASLVSHDLRNPLNVAEGHLELAREEFDSDHLETVSEAHDRMRALIEDLLTLAREGGRVEEVEQFSLPGIAQDCWRNVATPEATLVSESGPTIEADRRRLKQLLENLVRNAVEHGGPDVTVTVGELDGAEGFYVADDGPGIPAGERETVFESGYSTSEDGTGFGLAIVEEIADAHGWTVDVTESDDGGARFEISGVAVVDRDRAE